MDTQFNEKLRHVRFYRTVALILEVFYSVVLLFMLYYHYPWHHTFGVLILGACVVITAHLNLNAMEDEIGIPHSRFFLFPIFFR